MIHAVRDTLPPRLVGTLPPILGVNASGLIELTFVDDTSGIAGIAAEYTDEIGTATADPEERQSTPGEALTVALRLPDDRPEATLGALSVVVEDKAGNQEAWELELVHDHTPPDVAGAFQNITLVEIGEVTEDWVLSSLLNSSVAVADDLSGIKEVTITHWNESEPATARETVLGAPAGEASFQQHTVPIPNGSMYALHVRAVDAAGNVRATNLSLARVWVAPALSVEAPYYRNSSAVGWLHTLGSTLLPHQGSRLVEWELKVRDNGTSAVVYQETTNLTGTFSKPWNASNASPGLYNVTLRAGNGPVARVAWFNVRVDAPSATEPTPLDWPSAYGRLENDTSIAWYKLTWSGCGNAFTARARSMDGTPIHFFVESGASHYGDRDTFDHRLTSNATAQSVRIASPAQGQEYTLVATTPAAQGSPFELRVEREGCGGNDPDPATAFPNIQIQPLN